MSRAGHLAVVGGGRARRGRAGTAHPHPARLAPPLRQVDRTFVLWKGRRLIYFGGCDYFRLASHPVVLAAVREGLKAHGLNVAASRMTTGNHPLYEQLERRLAQFFGAESAVLVSSGYLTNRVAARALAGSFTHALLDEGAHSCLEEAAEALGCPVRRFKHRDLGDFNRVLKRCGPTARPIVLTDGLFARDGEVAPLPAYLAALPPGGAILLDDAHGAGTLGRTGRGTTEYLGVSPRRVIRTITLSKAFGVYGGAILGPAPLRDRIHTRSEAFVGNTPLPLPLASGALQALGLLRRDRSLRARLLRNTARVKSALRQAGWGLTDTPAPIIPFRPRDATEAAALCRALLRRGIYPSFIRYPGGPADGYFRFALSSEHTREQLGALLSVLVRFAPGRAARSGNRCA